MRLLLDEHYSCTIAERLRQRGVDAVAIQKERPDLEGQDDEVVLRVASAERIVSALAAFVQGTRDDDPAG